MTPAVVQKEVLRTIWLAGGKCEQRLLLRAVSDAGIGMFEASHALACLVQSGHVQVGNISREYSLTNMGKERA